MRVAIVGATGNIGHALLHTLLADPSVEEVVAVARRLPTEPLGARVRWTSIDIAHPDAAAALTEAFQGCAAVVHLAWLIQPVRRPDVMRATNVDGSARVFEAVRAASVPTLVYASSVGTYAPAPRDAHGSKAGRLLAEDWPTTGVVTCAYSVHKAAVEDILDRFETDFPQCRVVRIRPGIVLSGAAAASQTRYFAGPLLPRRTLGLLLRGHRQPDGTADPTSAPRRPAARWSTGWRRPGRLPVVRRSAGWSSRSCTPTTSRPRSPPRSGRTRAVRSTWPRARSWTHAHCRTWWAVNRYRCRQGWSAAWSNWPSGVASSPSTRGGSTLLSRSR
ncbi:MULTISPECIES: NAD-dependent epimerase/dehydratase family protein [Pseudofrankia]|uniref:NAD-dependent epimerase/dehydratase family protein n=1 Tax=Pseudofrankia TaxID=2994363 RepID=UPI00030C2120|nr:MULTISPECIES: NAD-dependent epimerase/dehydratase family protein [Pseudofrankia]OHV33363.1 hypothetical protein BCD49_27230 [Pseudofrankia sp. EUN1h]